MADEAKETALVEVVRGFCVYGQMVPATRPGAKEGEVVPTIVALPGEVILELESVKPGAIKPTAGKKANFVIRTPDEIKAEMRTAKAKDNDKLSAFFSGD